MNEPRAQECDTIGDGYAQLAWAVRPFSTWAARSLGERAGKWHRTAEWNRNPMKRAIEMAVVMSMPYLMLWRAA